MTTATQHQDQEVRLPNVNPSRLNGRVDALDGSRLHGWIWDETRPDEAMTVRLYCDGKLVCEAKADQSRIDLRRNGIGDGRHAFSMDLDEALLAARARLTVIGVSPTTGSELELRLPAPDELAAEAAIAVPLSRFFDKVEVLIALNRRGQLAQKELSEKLDRIAARLEENHALAEAAKVDAETQSEIARRLGELDVFQLRFDGTLRGFDERLAAIRKEARAPLRQVTVILGFLSGLAALMSFVSLAVLLWGG
ncbi:hypothetical protein ARD30_00075 [Bosea thiooxidans]|uniref:Membrane-anchored protein n=1 Tax=Bosea thiooxidans TaxID=53254 RepID=A0A0Q3KR07_9HYPH|nr:hypothetical protein [Bosea thiooxidans]KQK32219.1 hypothetical protein ARD30_00075 [Bosea thiooxidans]SKC10500.1 hypothetical protein SAMN05660750_04278 [Bosea thiooxidans]